MANNAEFGLYVPTTYIWDVEQIENLDPALKELLVRMYQNMNTITVALNLKESAYYDTSEFVTGAQFFPNPAVPVGTVADFRPPYRMVVNFGALPNAALKSVAHNIPVNNGYTITRFYASSFNPTTLVGIPIPYASVAADNIEMNLDATNVNITTLSNRTGFTNTIVVIEYLKF